MEADVAERRQASAAAGFTIERVHRREMPVGKLQEVIVKKLRYHAATLTQLDVFGLAAAAAASPEMATVLAAEAPDILDWASETVRIHAARHAQVADVSVGSGSANSLLAADLLDRANRVIDEAAQITLGHHAGRTALKGRLREKHS